MRSSISVSRRNFATKSRFRIAIRLYSDVSRCLTLLSTTQEPFKPLRVARCLTPGHGLLLFLICISSIVFYIDAQAITVFAGNGTGGNTGDGGQATSAEIRCQYLSFDPFGTYLYFTDEGNSVVRRVEAATGIISTVLNSAAGLNGPRGLDFDPSGNMYIANTFGYQILKVNAVSGVISVFATDLKTPDSVTYNQGAIFISDTGNNCIRKVDLSSKTMTTVAGICGYTCSSTTCVTNGGYSGDGGPAVNAKLNMPTQVSLHARGGDNSLLKHA